MSLATKYRPKTFEDCCGQNATIKILTQQIATGKISNCYLFAGPSGTGKTTIARILANRINNGKGTPIEIDGASNNGVDAVRQIVDNAKYRSVDCEYKVFIIDECHALSNAAWQAFLKCIEEPPKYTIFMFCTTNPEKIPETINNRLLRLNLSKVNTTLIKDRLMLICKNEGYTNYAEACEYISKIGDGGVRDSIAYLEKCANYSTDLSIDNVLNCLGNFSYNTMFDFTGAIFAQDTAFMLETLDNYYNAGFDLKLWIEQYLDFVLDLTKYCLFNNIECLKIPNNLQNRCEAYSNVPDILIFSNKLVEAVLNIKNTIKNDPSCHTTIEAMFVKFINEVKV